MIDRDIIAFAGLAEPVSSLTHLLAALAYLLSAPTLLRRVRGDRLREIAVGMFLLGMTGMFLASGSYHALDPSHPQRELLRHIDHGMIWVAIGSTISALSALAFPEKRGERVFVWALAVFGISVELFFLETLPSWVAPVLYVLMGNLGLFPVVRIFRERGPAIPGLFVLAGIASMSGAAVEAIESPNLMPHVFEAHELLHVFIATSMGLFWWGILRATGIEPIEKSSE